MITLHCTAKLAKRFKLQLEADPHQATNRLGNWYGNVLNVGSRRFVVLVNEATLLPVILPARATEFPRSFPAALRDVLIGINVPPEVAAREAAASEITSYAKTSNRSVLGSMNEIAFHAELLLRDGDRELSASIDLADMPSLVMGAVFPSEAVLVAFGLPVRERRKQPSA